MHLLRDISINGKLKIVIMMTSSVALLVACAAFVTYDLISTRKSMASDLATLTKIIGENSTAALAFSDNDSAKEVLHALVVKQPVVRARLYSPDGTVFAEYLRDAASPPAIPKFETLVSGSRFEGGYLIACEPIVLDGETVGSVAVVSDLNALDDRVGQNSRAVALVLLGSLLVALVISSRLQRMISGPISHLAKTARAVSVEKDYNIRAVKTSRDELGMLIDGFNEMLSQIQGRDVELQNARDQLERRVEERTAQLQQEIGERKQAEETLRESEALFRSLSESVTAAIYIYRNGRYVYLNPAAEMISGYSRDELMGMEVWDLVHPDFREEIKARTELRLAGGDVPSRTEFKILTKNGEARWLDLSGSVIRFHGEPAVLATAFDVTERKGWEDALRESEEKYRTILENIQEGYYEVDLKGNLTFFNNSLSRIVGSSPERLMGLNNREYADAASVSRSYEAFHSVFLTGVPIEGFHNRIITQEGEEKFLESSILLRRDSTGQISGFRGTVRDITERQLAEEALRRTEERNRALIDAMPDALTRISRDGTYLDARFPRDYPIYTTVNESVVGRTISDVMPPDVAKLCMESIECVLATGEGQTFEYQLPVAGEVRFREARMAMCGSDEVVCVMRDITERKQGIEALRKSEDKFKSLFEKTADAFFLLDGYRFIDCNTAAVTLLGYDNKDQLLEMGPTDVSSEYQPDGRRSHEKAHEMLALAVENGSHRFDWVSRRRDGEEFYSDIIATSVEVGNRPMVYTVVRDMTERRLAEEALRESEERYKTLFESATDGIMIFEAEGEQAGRIVAANPAAAEGTGYTVEELLSLTIADLHPPEEELKAEDRQRLFQGERLNVELLRRRKDGTTFPIEVNAGLLTLGGKRFILSFSRDLTQRKQIEKEVTMLAHAVRSIQECVSITDIDHVVLFVNDAFVRTYGFERDEVIGKKLIDLVRLDRVLEPDDPLGRTDPSRGWEGELLNRRKDGTVFTIHLTVSPIQDDLGRTIALAGVSQDITERKKIEKEVTMLAHTVRSITESVVVTDLEGNIIFVNDAATQMFGYKRDEAIGQHVTILHSKHNSAEFVSEVVTTARASRWEGEMMSRRKDGVEFPTYLSASDIQDETGRAIALVGVSQDITERKRAEEALRASEEQYRLLFQRNLAGVYRASLDGRLLDCNEAAVRILGYDSIQEALLHSLWEFYYDPAERQAMIKQLVEERSISNLEARCRSKNGEVVWVLANVSLLDGSNGSPQVIEGTLIDITARKQAEKEVAMLAHAVRSIKECVSITDIEEIVLFVNDAFLKTYGHERDEVIGKCMPDLVLPQSNSSNIGVDLPPRHLLNAWEGELINRRKDGTEFPIHLSASPISDESGQTIALVGVAQDITERKHAIEELKKAKEAAETANHAKSEFLANMSHEIRTPMNGIIGMTELALETDLNSEQREYLGMLQTSAGSLLTVINDILDFSKIEAGKLELDPIDFSLRDSLAEIMRSLAGRAHDKQLELAVQIPPDVPDALVGDPGRLRQVLINLVGNAIKFTEAGEVVVRVEKKWDTDEVVWVQLSVSDTGIGIPPDKQKLVFNAFTQADGSTSRKYGGTGLGLAISTQLVELMGGEIWLESEPGHGSTFYFTAHFGLQQDPAPLPTSTELLDLTNLHVLVVDDNETNRRILEEVLHNWNMKPTMADSGEAALNEMVRAASAGQPFRLVLLDACMPGMDGFGLAARIRETPDLASAIIMMLTSNNQRDDAARCRELGVGAYLVKPVTLSNLFDSIMTVLGMQSIAAAPSRPAVSKTQQPGRKGLYILLAEDNLVNQKLAVRVLEKQGHTVVVAENGRKALAALESERFDVVLMDVQMPEMNGFEATAEIRKREITTGAHIPIIAMTAHALKGDRERCLAAGMDDYVSKPIRPDELAKAIETQAGVSAVAPVEARERAPDEDVFDAAALLARVDGDSELLQYIVELFLEELPRLLSEVRAAVERQDSSALDRAAHTLRGSVGNFHAGAVVELALRLETMGREGSLTGAKEALARLEHEVERLKPALIALGKEQLIYEGLDR